MNYKFYPAYTGLLVAALAFSGCSMLEEKDPVMLTVDDTEYLKSEVQILVDQAITSVQENYGQDWADMDADGNAMTELVKGALEDRLLNTLVFASMAGSEGFSMSSEQEKAAQEQADEYLTDHDSVTDEDAAVAVTAAFRDQALADAYKDSIRSLAGENLTEKDAAVLQGKQLVIYYTDDTSRSEAKQTMTNILAMLDEGSKFNQLVSLYNEADQINIQLSMDQVTEEWQSAAFDLEAGEVSDLIELDDAYMLFQCIDPMDESLTAANLEKMKEEKQQELLDSAYDKYTEAHDIAWNYSVWDKWDITGE